LRAENDRLRAERRSAEAEQSLKQGRVAKGIGRVKPVSVKTAQIDVRKVSRATRSPRVTLPDALLPRRPALE
jgi:hypothetical protein